MIKNLLFIILFFHISNFLYSKPPKFPPPECHDSPYGKQLTILGDSRIFFLNFEENYIKDAKFKLSDGTELGIIDSDSLQNIQSWGWGGSKVLPSVTLNPLQKLFEDLQQKSDPIHDWYHRIDECIARGIPYRTTDKVVIQLGGNDILSLYKNLEELDAWFLLSQGITDPVRTLFNFISGKKSYQSEAFWLWTMETHQNLMVEGMKKIALYQLDNLSITTGRPHEVLIVTVAPALNADHWFNQNYQEPEISRPLNWQTFLRLGIYLGRLNTKYATQLYPYLLQARPSERVHFMDMYFRYLQNILFEGADFYIDPKLELDKQDGIHFAPEGNAEFGKMLAMKMVSIGWFPISEDLKPYFPLVEKLDPKYMTTEGIINIKAYQVGIPPEKALETPLQTIFDSNNVEIGYKKDFDGRNQSIYLKKNTYEAYVLGGSVLSGYKKEGEGASSLGFPTSHTHSTGSLGTIKRAFFECGYITHNTLEVTNPNNYLIHGREACPTLIAGSPDFKSNCEEPGICVGRWFEDYMFQLEPTSGQAISGKIPVTWTIIDSGGFPGILDSSGRLRGGPTNNPLGDEWKIRVKMIDQITPGADLNTVGIEKDVYIKIGL